jgi:phage terminase large subunit
MVRKTYKSLISSVVVTYERKILPAPPGDPRCPVTKYGGERPDFYSYPNGSRVVLGGMDNADKFLSAEFDFIYVNQAEELTLDDWEKLMGRATGRAGNTPYAQIMGDCNPGPPRHWIRQRDTVKLLTSRHEDNPVLYNPDTGEMTEQGKRTMSVLNALTGVRYKRGRLGLWAGQEGMVYEEWNEDIHLIDRFDIPDSWARYRSIDFGYTNPFNCQWWAVDEDGRMYLYREIYMSKRTVRAHAEQINELSQGERYVATVADHDAEDRATLEENGIKTVSAKKAVSVGIEKVQERLKVQGDGRPRAYILRDSLVEIDNARQEARQTLCTVDEIDGYVYPESKEGKAEDENPVKVDDHGMDSWRYLTMHLEKTKARKATTKRWR